MRTPLAPCIIVLSLFAASLPAQTGLWSKVSNQYNFREKPIDLRPAEVDAIKAILKSPSQRYPWESCIDDVTWVDAVTFSAATLSPTRKTVLVESGAGCARGGQGANGAMWIFEINGHHARLLASPKEDFSGWPYSVQLSGAHGYRDIVVGWHMSAAEADLTYFRFDGRSYRKIGSALLVDDGDGGSKIVPKDQSPATH
jgi:hypothetical protein